jgi:hypothetical protein
LYFLSGIIGIAIALIAWFMITYFIARAITLIETRHPELTGSRAIRVGEILACAVTVVASLALAFWVARLLVIQ